MSSAAPGPSTSPVAVTNVSQHGFWLFVGEQELFVSFAEFPWFREAAIGALTNVQLPSPHHLYWPDLDIDLAVESIEHPEKYPLVSQAQPNACISDGARRDDEAPRLKRKRQPATASDGGKDSRCLAVVYPPASEIAVARLPASMVLVGCVRRGPRRCFFVWGHEVRSYSPRQLSVVYAARSRGSAGIAIGTPQQCRQWQRSQSGQAQRGSRWPWAPEIL